MVQGDAIRTILVLNLYNLGHFVAILEDLTHYHRRRRGRCRHLIWFSLYSSITYALMYSFLHLIFTLV